MKGSTMKPIKKIIALLSAPIFICTPDLKSQVKGSTISIIPQFGFVSHCLEYRLSDKESIDRGYFAVTPPDYIPINGNSFGFYAAYTPQIVKRLTLSFRAGYTRYFTSTSLTTRVSDSDVSRTVSYAFNESSLEPMVIVHVWKGLNVSGGLRFSILNREFFNIKSEIHSGSYRFKNGNTFEQRSSSGLPQNIDFYSSYSLGASYDIELSEKHFISPEVLFSFDVPDFFSRFEKQSVPIRTGISFKYVLNE